MRICHIVISNSYVRLRSFARNSEHVDDFCNFWEGVLGKFEVAGAGQESQGVYEKEVIVAQGLTI